MPADLRKDFPIWQLQVHFLGECCARCPHLLDVVCALLDSYLAIQSCKQQLRRLLIIGTWQQVLCRTSPGWSPS